MGVFLLVYVTRGSKVKSFMLATQASAVCFSFSMLVVSVMPTMALQCDGALMRMSDVTDRFLVPSMMNSHWPDEMSICSCGQPKNSAFRTVVDSKPKVIWRGNCEEEKEGGQKENLGRAVIAFIRICE